MKPFCALSALVLLLLPTHFPAWMEGSVTVAAASAPEPLKVLRGTIGRNETLGRVLGKILPASDVYRLVQAARPAYDLARLAVGHPFGLALSPEGVLNAFTYGIDELRTLRVRRQGEALKAEVITRSYETKLETATGTIRSSLFTAVTDAGENDQLALDLADIFAWDVDFNSELQEGDSFRLAVEKLYLDGRFVRYGVIVAAELVRGERVLEALRFDAARGPGYYAPDGAPLRKAFLRSPLRFTRISSGFTSARFHPILHELRAHFGIDYAAPLGTPVLASADGVVSQAGWDGGYGQAVRIRHANGFETLYGHLSRIDVRPGQRVVQGGSIGAVGATGLATGPHLDYRMLRGGVFVNPLRIQSPPAEPLADDERAAFQAARARGLALLDRVAAEPRAALEPATQRAAPRAPRRP
jgi:murein DD-endopeptidase MepM/ murein hydrolase activator NlpD